MKIQQIYTGCLSQGAYYIESNGEAAIIDPLRDINPYIQLANKNQSTIKYIFETHFHADFVSGHVTLAQHTNAQIIYGPNATPSFEAIIAKDSQKFKLGNITIQVLHTPGHTMESSCFLVIDENQQPHALFTGDTLFLGDVGRPDLAQKATHLTQEYLAGILFDSLRDQIMPLPNQVIIYPGHGAGSACGKNLSKDTIGTLGDQKKNNYALRANMTKEEFIKEVTTGLLPPPKYFPLNVALNKEGYSDIETIIQQATHAYEPETFLSIAQSQKPLILDVRSVEEFAKAHVPGSIFIGLNGSFAPWAGTLIEDTMHPILLITPKNKEEETITRLSRVGFDNVLGYLKDGFESWIQAGKEYDTVDQLDASTLTSILPNNPIVFDVRKEGEYNSERLENAINIPLEYLNEALSKFPISEKFYIHCAGGYRSMIAASILKSRGIHNFYDIKGGFNAIKDTTTKIFSQECPSKRNIS